MGGLHNAAFANAGSVGSFCCFLVMITRCSNCTEWSFEFGLLIQGLISSSIDFFLCYSDVAMYYMGLYVDYAVF